MCARWDLGNELQPPSFPYFLSHFLSFFFSSQEICELALCSFCVKLSAVCSVAEGKSQVQHIRKGFRELHEIIILDTLAPHFRHPAWVADFSHCGKTACLLKLQMYTTLSCVSMQAKWMSFPRATNIIPAWLDDVFFQLKSHTVIHSYMRNDKKELHEYNYSTFVDIFSPESSGLAPPDTNKVCFWLPPHHTQKGSCCTYMCACYSDLAGLTP